MAIESNLGKVGITPKGEYDAGTSYERLDFVTLNGSGYVCVSPSVGERPDESENWKLAASKGDTGAVFTPSVSEDGTLSWSNESGLDNPPSVIIKGERGETGATGPQGPQGEPNIVKGPAYANAEALEQAVQDPKEGDQYNVGSEPPYNVYRWTGSAWEDQGKTQGPEGQTGQRGSLWYNGTGITGVSKSPNAFPDSGVESALPGDCYLNTRNGYLYACVTGGDAATATWSYLFGTIGATGTPGSVWYSGTGITGTDPTGQRFPTSDVTYYANFLDRYINTETYNIYKCTESGSAKVARWAYEGCLLGAQGEKGDTGTTFTPKVSPEGMLSWENDGNKQNPDPVSIKGPQGEQGEVGQLPTYTATALTGGWRSAGDLWSNTVTCEGLTADTSAIVDITQTGTEETDAPIREAWATVTRAVAGAGQMTLYAQSQPEVAIPLQLQVVNLHSAANGQMYIVRRGGGGVGKSIADAVVTLVPSSFTYNGQEKTQEVQSVVLGKETLEPGTDYIVVDNTAIGAGTHRLCVLGILKYSGAVYKDWSIAKAQGSISVYPTSVSFSSSSSSENVTITYTGDGEIYAQCNYPQIVSTQVTGRTLRVTSLSSTGSSTVTVTLDAGDNYTGDSCTLNVSVSLVSRTLEQNSWETIAEVSAAGQASTYWSVGDTKSTTINGRTYHAQIIGFGHDDLDTGDAKYGLSSYMGGRNKAGITFQIQEASYEAYPMNNSKTNSGGWNLSLMRTKTCAQYLSYMESSLRNVLRKVSKKTTSGGKSTAIQTTQDTVFLPSRREICGTNDAGYSQEGSRYSYYSSGNVTTKSRLVYGQACSWWLRSPSVNYTDMFNNISDTDPGGTMNSNAEADAPTPIAPCFCV